MFDSKKSLVDALQDSTEGGVAPFPSQIQIERQGIGLGALILSELPEGANKELAKQRLVECILFCKQSIRLKS